MNLCEVFPFALCRISLSNFWSQFNFVRSHSGCCLNQQIDKRNVNHFAYAQHSASSQLESSFTIRNYTLRRESDARHAGNSQKLIRYDGSSGHGKFESHFFCVRWYGNWKCVGCNNFPMLLIFSEFSTGLLTVWSLVLVANVWQRIEKNVSCDEQHAAVGKRIWFAFLPTPTTTFPGKKNFFFSHFDYACQEFLIIIRKKKNEKCSPISASCVSFTF